MFKNNVCCDYMCRCKMAVNKLQTYKELVVWIFTSCDVNIWSNANMTWQQHMYLEWNVMTLGDLCAGGVEWACVGFPYLGRLLTNTFPWLQKSCGGGEPDAEQTKRISSPRKKSWLWGWITTDGASTDGIKQANCWRLLSKCLMTWVTKSLPALSVWLYFIFTFWLFFKLLWTSEWQ